MNNENDRPLFSFAIIADSHLANKKGFSVDGSTSAVDKIGGKYRDLLHRVNAMNPEFVVHLGDFADPVPVSPHYDESAQAFHEACEALTMPCYMVPGNHDIGEKIHTALPEINDEVSITPSAIAQYQKHFGPQRHSFQHNDCLFVVLNTMLLNSGLEDEQEQWQWLERTLRDNAGRRVFVFAHYPPFLSSRDEPDYYDNIDEPARSRLLDMLEPHNVEGYYAGHVHNFFYNHLNGMHLFVVPSASIIRIDYTEFYRTSPTRDVCRFDPAKTGFFWVDVYADRHVPYLIRTNNEHPYRTHSWNRTGSTVTMDLRMPWCDEADVPTPWGVEIFERKYIRNDYPLSALWEMGITDLRIPISDILNPRVASRVKQLSALGHRFTVVMFGLPNDQRRAALAEHSAGIRAIEVVALFSQWQDLAAPLKELRQASAFEVYLHAVRPEVQGWTTNHGMHADLTDEVDWVLRQAELRDAVDGFVFGVRPDMPPCDGYAAVERCLSNSTYKPLLHVPCIRMDWIKMPTDETSQLQELSRVAEAVFLARAHPGISIVLDNFVEVDRGYGNCRGMVDRLYNPKDASRVTTALNCLLPRQMTGPVIVETQHHRVVASQSDAGHVMLIVANSEMAPVEPRGVLADQLSDRPGTLVDLVTGEKRVTSYSSLIAGIEGADKSQAPMLLSLKPSQN